MLETRDCTFRGIVSTPVWYRQLQRTVSIGDQLINLVSVTYQDYGSKFQDFQSGMIVANTNSKVVLKRTQIARARSFKPLVIVINGTLNAVEVKAS